MVTVAVTVQLLLVSAIFISNFLVNVNATLEGDDRDALTAFKDKITADYNNCIESWDPSHVNACRWSFVTCNSDNRVTHLLLGGCNMTGELVPQLGKLHMLNTMNLYNNVLSGNIPPEIGDITALTTLNLGDNSLKGSLPRELGKLVNLGILNTYTNALTGNIPPEIGDLTALKTLDLGDNSLEGSIPRELGKLVNLRMLQLSGNNLSGTVPVELANIIPNIVFVDLTNNGGLKGLCTQEAC